MGCADGLRPSGPAVDVFTGEVSVGDAFVDAGDRAALEVVRTVVHVLLIFQQYGRARLGTLCVGVCCGGK